MTIWSRARPSARAGVSAPSIRPVRRNSCWAPPATAAFARVGCANRRSLTAARRRGRPRRDGLGVRRPRFGGFAVRGALRGRAVGVRGGAFGLASGFGSASMALDLGRVDLLRLRRGVELGDLGQAPVRVGVAVGVLDLDEAAEALGDADLDDLRRR